MGGGGTDCLSEEYCVLRDSAQGVCEMRCLALENSRKFCLQISTLWTSENLWTFIFFIPVFILIYCLCSSKNIPFFKQIWIRYRNQLNIDVLNAVIKIKTLFSCTLFSFKNWLKTYWSVWKLISTILKNKIKLVKCSKTTEVYSNVELKGKGEINLAKGKTSSCISTWESRSQWFCIAVEHKNIGYRYFPRSLMPLWWLLYW